LHSKITDNPGGQARAVTTEQMELISADPAVMRGQAMLAGGRRACMLATPAASADASAELR